VQVTVISVPGCPHVARLEERLAPLLAERPGVTVSRLVIATEEEAARSGMHGSPTILVDGVDPFAPSGCPASLSCRLYRDSAGQADGAPTVGQLRHALGAPLAPGARGTG
jgi:hypothetical protein